LADISRFEVFLKRAKQRKAPKPDPKTVYNDFLIYRHDKDAPVETETKPEKPKKPKQPEEDFLK